LTWDGGSCLKWRDGSLSNPNPSTPPTPPQTPLPPPIEEDEPPPQEEEGAAPEEEAPAPAPEPEPEAANVSSPVKAALMPVIDLLSFEDDPLPGGCCFC
jgi:hypothetical protein